VIRIDLRQDLKSFQADVRALRDEVRLKLHLAGMDLRQEWEKLEPQLDRVMNSAVQVSAEAVADVKRKLNDFRRRLMAKN
jgi:hypothetical protein